MFRCGRRQRLAQSSRVDYLPRSWLVTVMLLRERRWSLNFTHHHPQADVQAVSDGCNAVKYNLTTDVIQAIFRTYPSGKRPM